MVRGDIYIGKETLDSYSVIPSCSMHTDLSIEIHHQNCQGFVELYNHDHSRNLSPHEFLKAILTHEKVCPDNDPNKNRANDSS